jgi:hypothetical protein
MLKYCILPTCFIIKSSNAAPLCVTPFPPVMRQSITLKKNYSFCLMVEASDHGCLTHKTYTCHTVQNITDTHNVVALYIDECLGFHDILVYWNESMLYNFQTSNYVQRKTYTTKAATVHLNCSTVPCNTLSACIAAAV